MNALQVFSVTLLMWKAGVIKSLWLGSNKKLSLIAPLRVMPKYF
jgi:hypothetical protein